jgi:hypothetical protein
MMRRRNDRTINAAEISPNGFIFPTKLRLMPGRMISMPTPTVEVA